jgi:nucleosome binding factor SPN SPT16 subunit
MYLFPHSSTVWGNADCLLIHRGAVDDDNPYLKSMVIHQWLFGYELPDTIILLTNEGDMYMLGTKKKCEFLQPAAAAILSDKQGAAGKVKKIHLLVRSKEDANAANYETLWKALLSSSQQPKLGLFTKEREANVSGGGLLAPWEQKINEALEEGKEISALVDVSAGVAFTMSVKDETELDLMKKSSVLSNKVMKHGYVKKMEEVIDSEKKITHEAMASYIDQILEDPSKIGLKVPAEEVQSCYFPIVQSGGNYDLRVSAYSSTENLSHDIILASLGARYRNYCSSIARTFLVDPPKRVSEIYELLLEVQEACLQAMKPGNPMKNVHKAAVSFLQQRGDGAQDLVEHLPKTLGFLTGLDFREPAFLLSPKNSATIKQGMVFCLSVGFQNLKLSEQDRAASADKSPVSVCCCCCCCRRRCFHITRKYHWCFFSSWQH